MQCNPIRRSQFDMKSILWLLLIGSLSLLAGRVNSSAQSTAFTYQGLLNDGAKSADGYYDFSLRLYPTNVGGTPVGIILTNSSVAVSNGLFTTVLDFGPVFDGTSYWLEIGVQKTGNTNGFILLSPRQSLGSSPYAIHALSAGSVSGVLSPTNMPVTVVQLDSSPAFTGTVTASNIYGNGSGLTNLNASQLNSGTVLDARLSANIPLLNRTQTFAGINTFTGNIKAFASTGAVSIYHPNAVWYYSLGNGGWFYNSIAFLQPSLSGDFAFDIIPKGGPNNAWIDICDTDVTTNNAISGEWLHLQKCASSFSSVSSFANGNGQIRPLVLQETGGNVGIDTTTPEAPLHVNGQDQPVPVYITSTTDPGIMFNNQLIHQDSTVYAYIGVATSSGDYLDQAAVNDFCLDASSRLLLGTGGGIGSPPGVTQIILSPNMLLITNVPVYIQTNIAPFTIDVSDLVLNRLYTNVNSRLTLVASVGLGSGAAAALYIGKDGAQKWITRIPVATPEQWASTNILTGWIQPFAVYCITNISSGGVSIISGSCQRVWQ